jgi:hypothetical protein
VAKVKANAAQRAQDLYWIVEDITCSGVTTVRGIAKELNRRGVHAPRGDAWHPTAVSRLLKSKGSGLARCSDCHNLRFSRCLSRGHFGRPVRMHECRRANSRPCPDYKRGQRSQASVRLGWRSARSYFLQARRGPYTG